MMKRFLSIFLALVTVVSMLSVCTTAAKYDGLVDSGLDYTESTEYIDNPMNAVPHCEFVTLQPDGNFTFTTTGEFHQFFLDMRLFSGGYTMVKADADGNPVFDEDGNYIYDGSGIQVPLTPEMKACRVTDRHGITYEWAGDSWHRGGAEDILLTEACLASLRASFEELRNNGGTCIVSPSYASQGEVYNEPYDFEMIIRHAKQLSEIFTEYSDVIGAIEIRTIGPFGEMWGSPYCAAKYANRIIDTYLSNTPDNIKVMVRKPGYAINYLMGDDLGGIGVLYTKDGEKLKIVHGAGHPEAGIYSIGHLVRYFEEDNIDGLDIEKFKRITMFNDGYMLTNADTGTWSDRETEVKWLAWATQYGYYGGEYGGGDRPEDEIWLPENALPEMYMTHVSYMHDNFYHSKWSNWQTYADTREEAIKYVEDLLAESQSINPDDPNATILDLSTVRYESLDPDDPEGLTLIQLDKTGYDHLIFTEELAKGCTKADVSAYYGYSVYTFIRNHIGYRFVVRDCDLTGRVDQGGVLRVSAKIENTGMANCIQEKTTQLVLTNPDGEEMAVVPLNNTVDANDWLSQETSEIGFEVRLANTLRQGEYKAYLRVCNVTGTGEANTKTCVRFANNDIYNADLKANYIGSFTVSETVSPYGNETCQQVTTVFEDVADTFWGVESIQQICAMGLMNGTSATTFAPNNTTTRGQFVTVLYNLERKPDVSKVTVPFNDVAMGRYYTSAVLWAYDNGIVNGVTSVAFDPNGKITRQQFATMLYRYAQYKGVDVSAAAELTGYSDYTEIGGYAMDAMKWANAEGYITGVSETTLKPKNHATRAQMATILMRYIKKVNAVQG